MRQAGSSIADNSSLGAAWSSSPLPSPTEHHFAGPQSSRVSNVSDSIGSSSSRHGKTASGNTLFPSHYRLPSLPHNSPVPRGRRSSMRSTKSVSGRSAVAGGQTDAATRCVVLWRTCPGVLGDGAGPRPRGEARDVESLAGAPGDHRGWVGTYLIGTV